MSARAPALPARRVRTAAGGGGRTPVRRLVALLVIMMLGVSGIVVRLVQLQVRDASAYQTLAWDQRVRTIDLPASRGSILDRTGRELALSLPAKAVFARPSLLDDPRGEARTVAAALGLDPADVLANMRKPGPFVYLAHAQDVDKVAALEAMQLPGIGFLPETRRYYPSDDLAAQILGFVGLDGTGLAGLEQEYQKTLAGQAGHEVIEADPAGVLIPQGENEGVPPVAGDDLVLTIDREIQYRAQIALQKAVKTNGAKSGTVIVLDPSTGDILAMANYPTFDPNEASAADPDSVRNRAVTDAYEPGSVNKVVTASAALEEGFIKVDQRLMVPDFYRLYTKTFHDVHPHVPELMTLGDILAYSSNIGAIKVAKLLGPKLLYSYLRRFGLTELTGLGFPGESSGILPAPSQWSGTSMGTIPIGQGIAVTPLQMAAVYATIANQGMWVQPRLIRSTIGPDGAVHDAAPPETRRVISPETAQVVSRMLGYAVDVGTGQAAQIPGYWVAGKTGTARKVNAAGTAYLVGKYVASFIGFVPASRPALVVAAVLDEPVSVYGGVAAAPLFRDVARFALGRMRIPPAHKLPIPPHAIRATA